MFYRLPFQRRLITVFSLLFLLWKKEKEDFDITLLSIYLYIRLYFSHNFLGSWQRLSGFLCRCQAAGQLCMRYVLLILFVFRAVLVVQEESRQLVLPSTSYMN
jgi:hypothetical protein